MPPNSNILDDIRNRLLGATTLSETIAVLGSPQHTMNWTWTERRLHGSEEFVRQHTFLTDDGVKVVAAERPDGTLRFLFHLPEDVDWP